MYIDYSKLWKLLIDKGISKTDLMELTGMSSRVLAKLSKNETVTTDTVARICSALSCDVGDIMECVSEERLSVYSAFKKLGVVTEENDLFRTVRFTRGKDNFVYITRSRPQTRQLTSNAAMMERYIFRSFVLWAWQAFYPIQTLS